MKALIRCFMLGMSIIVLIMMFSFFQEVNVRQDELNNIVATAMTQTQTVIKEQIEDKQYKTNNKRYAMNMLKNLHTTYICLKLQTTIITLLCMEWTMKKVCWISV